MSEIPWRKGGLQGGDLPVWPEGVSRSLDYQCVAAADDRSVWHGYMCPDGFLGTGDDGIGIEWRYIEWWCPLSELPVPAREASK